jgi:hypothetical protein
LSVIAVVSLVVSSLGALASASLWLSFGDIVSFEDCGLLAGRIRHPAERLRN